MPDLNTLAIIQARMSSKRLPDKVLLDIAGQPMLVRVFERTKRSKTIHQVVVATTTAAEDDPIAELCANLGYDCYRGSAFDVLDRYYQAASTYGAKVIVRITGDCPLIDPDVIDKTVQAFQGYDFAANRLPPPWGRTYPIGLDTEVCTFAALETAWEEADKSHQREHVMPFFYDHQERFHIQLVNHDEDFGSLRWTVDTAEDLTLVRQIYHHFADRDDFTWLEVLELFKRRPELADINSQVQHKVYNEVDERMGE
jgi:spore coat polysaccharide biosynthesis protein SpsF